MDETRYDVQFAGELLPGHAPAAVAENLGKLFKATPETVARLMGGGVHTLKRDADRDTALKYEIAMQRAGAKAILREIAKPAAGPAPAAPAGVGESAPAARPEPVAETPATAPITLAPAGVELLAEDERRRVEAVQVDTSHIKLASVFAVEAERPAPPPAPDVSHISVAAPGSDLLPGRASEPPPPAPDTSALSIAEPGVRLAPEDDRGALPEIDLSGITLAPPGAPLDELRPQRAPLDPDTSALGLQPLG